jgi:hypothetical protein
MLRANTLAYFAAFSMTKGRVCIILVPEACVIKLLTAIINSIMYKVSVFVIVNNFLFTLTNTPAFYNTESITAVKSFVIQAPGNPDSFFNPCKQRGGMSFSQQSFRRKTS